MYTFDAEPKYPRLRGRIVDVRMTQTSDPRDSHGRPLPFIANSGMRKVVFWTLLIVNGFIGVGLFVIWVAMCWDTASARHWRKRWEAPFVAAVEELKDTNKLEYDWIKKKMTEGRVPSFLNPSTKEVLQKKGIPEPSSPSFDTVGEGLAATLIFLGMTAVFTFTCLYIYTAPRY